MMIRLLFIPFFVFLLAAPLAGQAQGIAKVESLAHDLTVYLNPDTRSLKVTDRMTVVADGVLRIRLSPSFYVTALRLDGRMVNAMMKPGEMLLRLPEGRKPYELLLEYNGQLPGLPDDMQAASGPLFFTDPSGSFIPGASGWIPDLGKDLFTYKATLYTPPLHKAVVPGKLLEEETTERRYKAVFEMLQPADDISLFAGPYNVAERMHKGLRLRTYFMPDMKGLAEGYLSKTAEYIDLYSQWIGPYPFSEFSVVAGPLPVGYGFQGLTYMGANVLRLPFIKDSSLGHEILHNWWGNGVFTDYADGNWAEGLTTYMADYAFLLRQSSEKARERRLAWLRDFAALPPERDAPPRSFTSKGHTASQVIGYNKVAFLFHMLRNRLGNETFDKAIKGFWRNHRFTRASWDDLKAAFEQASGQPLDNYFKQWLDRKGAPRLSLVTAHSSGGSVTVTLAQSEPVYDMKLPLTVTLTNGEEIKFFEHLKTANATFKLQVSGTVNSLAVDPAFDIFRHLAEGEAPPILRDVTLAKNALVFLTDTEVKTRETARRLALRMMDLRPRFADTETDLNVNHPLLVIGLEETVTPFLARNGISGPPEQITGLGTARAWVGKNTNGIAYAIVAAKDSESLEAILRPLPHYGRSGYIAFKGRQTVTKGTTTTNDTPLQITFH